VGTKKYNKLVKLIISVITDSIGVLSYFVPVFGEFFDILWAFISALIVYNLYGNRVFTVLNFFEEIFPFTDIIPTATINWFYNYYIKK
jgi:hypothetical protein